jgi:predicted nuclease of predicted toxin-antitoxin system
MKLLLDECVPKRLKKDFIRHEVFTVDESGFKGLKNGRLLRAASDDGFEILITVDQNIEHQQNLSLLPISILVLVSKTNRYENLKGLTKEALEAIKQIKNNKLIRIEKHD